jgi:hypothetical protein
VYSTAEQHYAANQLAALIKKYPFTSILGVDPEKTALEQFGLAERRCRRYNKIFLLERKLSKERMPHLRELMRKWISKVIGFKPDFKEIWPLCDFGPGASVGVSGNATHLARKYLEQSWSVTPTALPYAAAALRSDPLAWELLISENNQVYCHDLEVFNSKLDSRLCKVAYNKISLVPKTALVHRTIAVEPLLNGYVQKGVDTYLRRRLFRYGIDLSDQSRNQRLARIGSIAGPDPFATIDLSLASDSISIGLAKDLLPPDWFEFLNSIRSPSYRLGGKQYVYHKFVSMGNGFCFPLESLIFSSVCASVYEHRNLPRDFSVYGDDIIVRASVAEEVLQLLRCIGFRHNPKKTFLSGPFRESCGADWFLGEDVRPITLDYTLDTSRDIFKLHNLTLRRNRPKAFFSEVRELLRARVPTSKRYLRPFVGDVDTAFEVEHDEFMASPFALWDRYLQSWSWKELVTIAVSDNSYSKKNGYFTVLMMAALRGSSSKSPFTKRRNTRTRIRRKSYSGGYSTWLPARRTLS